MEIVAQGYDSLRPVDCLHMAAEMALDLWHNDAEVEQEAEMSPHPPKQDLVMLLSNEDGFGGREQVKECWYMANLCQMLRERQDVDRNLVQEIPRVSEVFEASV